MHGQHFILLSFGSSLEHLPLLLETYRPQLCGIPLQILGNVKHLVDNTIHFLENIKRTEPLKMCFHEQDPKPNPVGRWAGQSVRSSRVTYWPFLRGPPFFSALFFSPDYKALWRVDAHKKQRTWASHRYAESSLSSSWTPPELNFLPQFC